MLAYCFILDFVGTKQMTSNIHMAKTITFLNFNKHFFKKKFIIFHEIPKYFFTGNNKFRMIITDIVSLYYNLVKLLSKLLCNIQVMLFSIPITENIYLIPPQRLHKSSVHLISSFHE